jgi:hypothetical protein
VVSPRKIVVDEIELMWTRRHNHEAGPCTETLTVWRADKPGGRLRVRFVNGQGGATTEGGGWGGYEGGLLFGDRSYNLNRPGVVAALVQQALREGWNSSARGERELDGFALLGCADTPDESAEG